jgi:chromosome segregation ATPase
LQKDIEELKNKKNKSKEEQEKLNKSVIELKNRENESNKQHTKLKQNIEKLNNKKDKSQEEQKELQKSIEELKSRENEAKKKIEELNDKKELLNKDLALLEEKNKNQYNKTDPDASVMVKPAHNLVAYNTQIAVDAKYKFIIDTYVSTKGNDKQELHKMGSKVQEVLDKKEINLAGDTGYHSAKEIKKCIEDGITPYVPAPKPKNRDDEKGKFTKSQFKYDKESDSYICPNNQHVKKTT